MSGVVFTLHIMIATLTSNTRIKTRIVIALLFTHLTIGLVGCAIHGFTLGVDSVSLDPKGSPVTSSIPLVVP